jgi:hypothetical protein
MDAKTCLLVLNNSNNEINNDINERNLTIKKKIKINAFITILHSIISLNIILIFLIKEIPPKI